MRRWLGWVAICWLVALCALALLAYGSPDGATSLDDRTRAVAQQLRCPVCQGESVADSPSAISKEMRTIIRTRLAEGQSPDAVKAYIVSRYGNWILLAPPVSGIGGLAWLTPPLLVLGGLVLLAVLIFDWRRRGAGPTSSAKMPHVWRVRSEVGADVTWE
jgi:cytochrome c-type biogenesis protein CcmH